MKIDKTGRGFDLLLSDTYSDKPVPARLLQQSCAVGNYANSYDLPGPSYLWVGDKHHLNREEVAEMIDYMQRWLRTGSLRSKAKKTSKRKGAVKFRKNVIR